MDDFETKPIDPDRLYLTLAKWLPAPHKLPEPSVAAIAEASPEIPQSAPFDFTVLGRLFQKDPAKVGHLAREFLHAAQAAVAAFEAARECRDLAALVSLGHRYKSAAAMAGAGSFAVLCQDIEAVGKAGDWPRLENLLSQMAPLVERIAVQIAQEVG